MLGVRSFERQHLRAASDTYATCHQVESVLDRSYPNKMVGLLVDVESTQSIKLLKTCSWGHVGKGSTKGLLWVAVLPVLWLSLLTMHYPDNCVFCFHPEENANGKPWVYPLIEHKPSPRQKSGKNTACVLRLVCLCLGRLGGEKELSACREECACVCRACRLGSVSRCVCSLTSFGGDVWHLSAIALRCLQVNRDRSCFCPCSFIAC